MRIIVFFDLPVTTKKDRKEYAKFRKFLINDGFIMIQFSVYSRTVRNHDDAKKHCRIIEANVPPKGSVRVLTVTEKQYTSMKLLVGEKLKDENLLDKKDIIEL
ncbi:MAG: CRISPR-associated endonuclease Cas2 [Ruminococcus sp.]|nr:CRISPR-associated endonuclease Cas2 [Ruminococcus sp.]